MAHTVETQTTTAASALREQLERAERQLPSLTPADLEDFLVRLDAIAALFEQFQQEGVDLRSESSRWHDLQQQVLSRAGKINRLAGQVGGLAALRTRHPPATGVWWQLDAMIAEQRRRWLRKTALVVGVLALLLVAATFVYMRFLAPSHETVLLVNTTSSVEQLVMEERWPEALAKVEDALKTLPGEPELLIWAGILSERMGDVEGADQYLEQARSLIPDQVKYLVALGLHRMQAGDLDGAIEAVDALVKLDPNEPQAYFILGSVSEERNQVPEAIQHYEKAAALAEQLNKPELTVLAKMRLANLLQRMNFMLPETPMDETTPAP